MKEEVCSGWNCSERDINVRRGGGKLGKGDWCEKIAKLLGGGGGGFNFCGGRGALRGIGEKSAQGIRQPTEGVFSLSHISARKRGKMDDGG